MIKAFIVGSSYFIDTESAKLIASVKGADKETFFCDELNKSELYSFVNSVNLFGDPKIALIRNAQHFAKKTKNADKPEKADKLDEFVKSLSSCTETHIIIAADKDGIKNPADVIKGTDFKLIKEEPVKGYPDEVRRIYQSQVKQIFKEKGVNISPEAALQIFEQTGGDMTMAKSEAEKFAIYMGSDKNISADELMAFSCGEKEESIYKLVDAFSEKETKEALCLYSSIPKTDDSLFPLFSALSKRITNIYFSYIDESLINEAYDFAKRKIIDYRRRHCWRRDEAAAMIGKAAELDLDIKTGRKLPENAINELIILSAKENACD